MIGKAILSIFFQILNVFYPVNLSLKNNTCFDVRLTNLFFEQVECSIRQLVPSSPFGQPGRRTVISRRKFLSLEVKDFFTRVSDKDNIEFRNQKSTGLSRKFNEP